MNAKTLDRHLKKAQTSAVHSALKAGAFLAGKFGKFRTLKEKDNQSLVTEADQGAEKIILSALRKQFNQDHFNAEETGSSIGDSEFRWHVDPLDGTTNFVHSFPFFCVSIGLEWIRPKGSEIVMGVIYQPMTKDLYFARKGAGAFKNGKRMRVSKRAELRNALFSTGFSIDPDRFRKSEIENLISVSDQTRGIRRTGSAALDLTFVATGQFDGFWERGLNTWDVAAGVSLIQEAGGTISQISGKPYHVRDETIVATNGKVHQSFIKLLHRS